MNSSTPKESCQVSRDARGPTVVPPGQVIRGREETAGVNPQAVYVSGPAVCIPASVAHACAALIRRGIRDVEQRDGIRVHSSVRSILEALDAASAAVPTEMYPRVQPHIEAAAEPDDRWSTTSEAAGVLGISERAARGLCERHTLEAHKDRRGHWQIATSSIRAYDDRPIGSGNSDPTKQRYTGSLSTEPWIRRGFTPAQPLGFQRRRSRAFYSWRRGDLSSLQDGSVWA